MKTPIIRKYEKVLLCKVHREECSKVDKTKKDCGRCSGTEQFHQRRNT